MRSSWLPINDAARPGPEAGICGSTEETQRHDQSRAALPRTSRAPGTWPPARLYWSQPPPRGQDRHGSQQSGGRERTPPRSLGPCTGTRPNAHKRRGWSAGGRAGSQWEGQRGVWQRGSRDTQEGTEGWVGGKGERLGLQSLERAALTFSAAPLPSPPLSFTLGPCSSPRAPRAMTIGHVHGHPLDTSTILHTWSPDTDRLVHRCADVTYNDKRSRRHTQTPTFVHYSNPTLARSPVHVHPRTRAHLPTQAGALCPLVSCLLPSRANLAAPGRGCSV